MQYFNWMSTFNWNFNDIFIVLIAEAMTEKFRQVNARIKNINVSIVRNLPRIRAHYIYFVILLREEFQ